MPFVGESGKPGYVIRWDDANMFFMDEEGAIATFSTEAAAEKFIEIKQRKKFTGTATIVPLRKWSRP